MPCYARADTPCGLTARQLAAYGFIYEGISSTAPLLLRVFSASEKGRVSENAEILSAMERWCVEEGFRFSKQGFGLEGVMARKMNALKNLVSLMLLAWSFLVNSEEEAETIDSGLAHPAGVGIKNGETPVIKA